MREIFTRPSLRRGGGRREGGGDRLEFRHSGIDYLVLLQSPAGVDDVYNYYVSRMRVSARRGAVTGGGNEVLSSANIYVMSGFESHPLSTPLRASSVEEALFTC